MSNARSGFGGAAVPTASRVRERVKVRRRRRTRKEPKALDSERWLTGATSRRLRSFTLGSAALLVLVLGVYLICR